MAESIVQAVNTPLVRLVLFLFALAGVVEYV